MFFKVAVLKNFAIFTRNRLYLNHFLITLQTWRPATILKKTPTQLFSCKYFEILRATIFIEHFRWLILLLINPFVSNALFLYLLKTSENRKVFWCFQGAEKGCIGNKWVNLFHVTDLFLYPLNFSFYTRGFLMFSGVIERYLWHDLS